jgi:hypothetical protein
VPINPGIDVMCHERSFADGCGASARWRAAKIGSNYFFGWQSWSGSRIERTKVASVIVILVMC